VTQLRKQMLEELQRRNWFSISPLFTDRATGSLLPRYMDHPELVFDRIWALPDRRLHALMDPENAAAATTRG